MGSCKGCNEWTPCNVHFKGRAPLVGMVGYAQAGKDTFGGMLGYHRMAFADKLKALALGINPMVGDYYDLRERVETHGWEYAKAEVPGVREFLQNLGVGVRVVLGADTWVQATFKDYKGNVPTVITDCRFPNELWAVKDLGGIIVRIDREGHGPVNNHESESAWQAIQPDRHYNFQDGDFARMKEVADDLRDWLA